MVNDWVHDTGNIMLSATPGRHTVMERETDGTIIRKTSQFMTVIYQTEDEFLEAEGEMRRRALIPAPKKEDRTDKPEPMNDDDERREKDTAANSDAGGPEGLEKYFPADDDEDDF